MAMDIPMEIPGTTSILSVTRGFSFLFFRGKTTLGGFRFAIRGVAQARWLVYFTEHPNGMMTGG